MASRASYFMTDKKDNIDKKRNRYSRRALLYSTTIDLDPLLIAAGQGMKRIPVMFFEEKKA